MRVFRCFLSRGKVKVYDLSDLPRPLIPSTTLLPSTGWNLPRIVEDVAPGRARTYNSFLSQCFSREYIPSEKSAVKTEAATTDYDDVSL